MVRTDLLTSEGGDADSAAPPPPGDLQGYECPLCRHRFRTDDLACHHGCPLSRRCQVICCPHCGYEFVDTEQMRLRVRRWSDWMRRLFGRAA